MSSPIICVNIVFLSDDEIKGKFTLSAAFRYHVRKLILFPKFALLFGNKEPFNARVILFPLLILFSSFCLDTKACQKIKADEICLK